jgi:hypothetical protein
LYRENNHGEITVTEEGSLLEHLHKIQWIQGGEFTFQLQNVSW